MDQSTRIIDSPKKALVSIAIPAYKSHWLAESIESALNQDYDNIELIIVDDHSPQNLKEVVTPYLKDSRVCYFYNEENLGRKSIVLNWNRCLELAKGKFFVLLCDDDLLLPNFVSTLVALARKYPDCNIFHGGRILKDENSGMQRIEESWPEYESSQDFLTNKFKRNRDHTITEFLYRTDHLRKDGYINFPLGWGSDDATILNCCREGGIASSSQPLALFRCSDEHLSNFNKHALTKGKAWILYYEWLLQLDCCKPHVSAILSEYDWMMATVIDRLTFVDRMKLLALVPSYLWPFWQKLRLLFR